SVRETVGRKTRRAHGAALVYDLPAPVLSRSQDAAWALTQATINRSIRKDALEKPPPRHGSNPARSNAKR
ncbi:MAG TPA: hypothetical protein VE641_11400, partial [Chthoniobacterales bacterium]|nr:hypothetical protein [Chthoniobacterales bacterium]